MINWSDLRSLDAQLSFSNHSLGHSCCAHGPFCNINPSSVGGHAETRPLSLKKINRTFQWLKDNWDICTCVAVYVNGYAQMCLCLLSNKLIQCSCINCPDGCGRQSQRSSLTPLSISVQFMWSLQQYCMPLVETLMGWDHIHLPSYLFIELNVRPCWAVIKLVTFHLLVHHVVNCKYIYSVCAKDLTSVNMT